MSYISVFTSIMTIVSNSLIFFVISVYLFELFFANVGHFWPFHKLAVVRLSIVLFSSFQRSYFHCLFPKLFTKRPHAVITTVCIVDFYEIWSEDCLRCKLQDDQ